jgi:hypothetical protein
MTTGADQRLEAIIQWRIEVLGRDGWTRDGLEEGLDRAGEARVPLGTNEPSWPAVFLPKPKRRVVQKAQES